MGQSASLPIAVRQLTKAYGAAYALDHVDLDVKSGEFLTLLGPSGSGKTTLLMVLAGFVRPDSGSVLFGTQEVVRLAPHKRNVGMVFQNYALFPHMDVAANIAFPLKLRGVGSRDIARRVRSALELVQLGGYGERHIDQLSGGRFLLGRLKPGKLDGAEGVLGAWLDSEHDRERILCRFYARLDDDIVITARTEELGQQVDVGAGAAVDLRRVGGGAAPLAKSRLLIEGFNQGGLVVDACEPFDKDGIAALFARLNRRCLLLRRLG